MDNSNLPVTPEEEEEWRRLEEKQKQAQCA